MAERGRKFILWGKRQLKIVAFTLDNYSKLGLNWQAVALSFFSTMAVVPLIAVIFSITDGFGISNILYDLIHKYFSNQEIINLFLGFANNILASTDYSLYGIISFGVFLWLVVWLMLCVERSFNNIWFVETSRVWWKRLMSYFLILLMAPFVSILFLGMAVVISNGIKNMWMVEIPFLDMRDIIQWLIFYGVAALIFATMFKFIPNAKVKFSNAFKAALLASAAFTIVQFFYLETQIFVTRINAVYGVFAAIPLFMVWVNIGWFIIIIGAQVSYSIQNLDSYHKEFHLSDLEKLNLLRRRK
ncbi:MAG: YihY/virulence factor BrkB family protein [Bacteroidales bacterium]|nr:YihY/virulence factor BrkB family protein [Bacteroidales bacterium]